MVEHFFTSGEWVAASESVLLIVIIVLAAIGTGILFVISALAYRRRGSRRYLLITIAIAALFARSLIGIGTVYGHVPMFLHHFIEHTLDFLIAVIILYTIYVSGPDEERTLTTHFD